MGEIRNFNGRVESISPNGDSYKGYIKYNIKLDNGETIITGWKEGTTPDVNSGDTISGQYNYSSGTSAHGPWEFKNVTSDGIKKGGISSPPPPNNPQVPQSNTANILKEVVFLNSAVLSAAGAVSNDITTLEGNVEKIRTLVWRNITADFERLTK